MIRVVEYTILSYFYYFDVLDAPVQPRSLLKLQL